MNKTLEIYHELFAEAQTKAFNPSKNISRKEVCPNGVGLIYSVSVGMRNLFFSIPVDKVSENISFPSWKGVQINIVTLPEYGSDKQLYIELRQAPETETYIFEIVVDDLRRGIEVLPGGKNIVESVLETLKNWRDFFCSGKLPVISPIEAQGLFGELLFLKELILNRGEGSISFWEGENSTHDYYIGQNAVEIKTCVSQAPYKAHINSAHQLDNKDVNGRLFLRVYALRKDHNGGTKLPEIINELRSLLAGNISALDTFNSKILRLGYIDSAEDFYREGYTIRDTYSFEIKEGFPRITVNDVPNGVSNLQYDVSVGACMKYVIDSEELMRGVKS